MTKYVVDAGVALHLVAEGLEVAKAHQLLAPTLIRSQTLSLLHEAVARGELEAGEARKRLVRVGELKMRLLGDGVMRRTAFDVASELGWASTYEAEYVALTRLQGDALVTLDRAFARRLRGVVEVASVDELS